VSREIEGEIVINVDIDVHKPTHTYILGQTDRQRYVGHGEKETPDTGKMPKWSYTQVERYRDSKIKRTN
jgi:hypothetical protein